MYTEMKINKLFILAALSLSLVSCSDLFEPAQESNRSLDEIYEEPTYAQGLLGYAYAMLPYNTKSVTDVATDDAVSNDLSNSYLKMATGSWAANNDPMNKWTSCRASIQYLNIFLQEVDKVDWAKDKGAQQMFCESRKGEAYALRALNMYYLLMNHGGWTEDGQLLGVPNLTKPEDTSSDFNQPRATFQACLDQIYSDLDQAEQLLPLDYNDLTKSDPVPEKYTAMGVDNYQDYNRVLGSLMRGRVSGRIAKAIRAQVSLLAASPAFAEGTNVNYKRAADDAASVLDLIGGVSGLSETGNSWYAQTAEIGRLQSGECPKEIIWRGNKTNGADDWDLGLNQEADNFPPSLYGRGRINPTQNLVNAFPDANGYPITDKRSKYDDLDPYSFRDPRLDLYIIYNWQFFKFPGAGCHHHRQDRLDLLIKIRILTCLFQWIISLSLKIFLYILISIQQINIFSQICPYDPQGFLPLIFPDCKDLTHDLTKDPSHFIYILIVLFFFYGKLMHQVVNPPYFLLII